MIPGSIVGSEFSLRSVGNAFRSVWHYLRVRCGAHCHSGGSGSGGANMMDDGTGVYSQCSGGGAQAIAGTPRLPPSSTGGAAGQPASAILSSSHSTMPDLKYVFYTTVSFPLYEKQNA